MDNLVNPTPPPGGREIGRGGDWQFMSFKAPGEILDGALLGTVDVSGETRYQVETKDGTVVLPGHWELGQKLGEIVGAYVLPVRTWICYRGEEKVDGKPKPIKRYTVRVYGGTLLERGGEGADGPSE